MKKIAVLLGFVALFLPLWSASARVYECDTLKIEVYPFDTLFKGSARVSLFVSHHKVCGEPPHQWVYDSLNIFVIPLCYTHTNPGKYCSLSYGWNNTSVYPYPDSFLQRSIFRHFISVDGETLIHDWMMDQSESLLGLEWDTRDLDLDDTSHFWLSTFASGSNDQCFWEASKVLLATMTFQAEDTMTICVDSCFWPPSGHLQFGSPCSLGGSITFTPVTNLPYCFSVSYAMRGDVNANGIIDIGDALFLINYLFIGGPAPVPLETGDGMVDISDAVYIINYLFIGGLPPGC